MELKVFTIDELKVILSKHAEWLGDSDTGERADLRSADLRSADLSSADLRYANLSSANLILIGQDIRGYLFWAYQGNDEVLTIRAGCRTFVGVKAARAHWANRHEDDNVLHEDCLSMVDRCERMAKVRGWKLEAE